jgi:hypothetical protein
MKLKNILAAAGTSLIILTLAACNLPQPTPELRQTPESQTPVNTTTASQQYHFVTNKLLLPTTQALTQAYALNIDGDAQQHNDNRVGELLTLLNSAAPDLAIQTTVDQTVSSGQLVTLHLIKTDDLKNAQGVTWSIFPGQATSSAPKFDGSDMFTLDPAAPLNLPLTGTLSNGHFSGGPGTAHIQVSLLGQTVEVNLIGVRLESDLSVMGCTNGILGGGVTVTDFRENLLPAIANGLNQIIKADPSVGGTLQPLLDSDKNGNITAQELQNNPLLMLAAAPDLDLLDASGNFNPNQDGVKDSYSIGVGFTCVPATFTAPGN